MGPHSTIRGILIDLDGVIWESDNVVAGGPETIAWLNEKHIPYLFVTNTTSRPRRLIADKLRRLGVTTEAERILTPPIAAAAWLAVHATGPAALIVPEATTEDFAGVASAELESIGQLAAIVVGDIGEAWTYPLLNRAFRALMTEPRPDLIALGMTRYWRADDGLRLDVAPFIKALEHAAGCEAIVLGKPSPDFFAIALEMLGCDANETLMIGDDLYGDVKGAQDAGLTGMLVKTGKFRPQDLDEPVTPDAVLESIAELPKWWPGV
jgi:HAD superfamily hydrolase (TIGR01458 family)